MPAYEIRLAFYLLLCEIKISIWTLTVLPDFSLIYFYETYFLIENKLKIDELSRSSFALILHPTAIAVSVRWALPYFFL